VELDKEINLTDSLAFKHELQQLDGAMEHVPGELSERATTTTWHAHGPCVETFEAHGGF
jgi:hypothetical protein